MSKSAKKSLATSSEEPISIKVVEAIAAAEDGNITELDPLYDEIDLEALEHLVASVDANLSIEWSMNGHRIEVDGTGTVRVT